MSLSFEELRQTNTARTVNDFHHTLESWSVAEWGNATAGEVGEACNIAKKMIRFRDNVAGNAPGLTVEELRNKLASEIADAVIYLDLWAASEQINLGEAVATTFNKKSEQLGSDYRLYAGRGYL
jgi:NTP pyrophosphatase (non-canonical NTP hydrolase)